MRLSGIVVMGLMLAVGMSYIAQAADLEETVVFKNGEDGYHTYRIPSVVTAKSGALLAIVEGRKSGASDHGDIDLVLKRSTDGGATWGALEPVYEEGGKEKITIGNPCPVVDQASGKIFLAFCRDNKDVFMTSSGDEGKTWAAPVDITASVKQPEWTWYATGPGVGIQIMRGPNAWRIVIPCDHREKDGKNEIMFSHVFYSDDRGATWKLGGSVAKHTDECQVAELDNGQIAINCRNYWEKTGKEAAKGGMRAVATSPDGGQSWGELTFDAALVESVCQASLLRYELGSGKSALLFSNPADKKDRKNMTVRISNDNGATWTGAKELYAGPSAYSCLAALPEGKAGCLYERGAKNPYESIVFARFPIASLAGEPATPAAKPEEPKKAKKSAAKKPEKK